MLGISAPAICAIKHIKESKFENLKVCFWCISNLPPWGVQLAPHMGQVGQFDFLYLFVYNKINIHNSASFWNSVESQDLAESIGTLLFVICRILAELLLFFTQGVQPAPHPPTPYGIKACFCGHQLKCNYKKPLIPCVSICTNALNMHLLRPSNIRDSCRNLSNAYN